MSNELVRRAREYLAHNAAESGADVLISDLAAALERSSERTAEASKADYDHGYAIGYEHGYEETDAPLREAVTSYLTFLRKSVNVGPLTKGPSKEAALLRRLMELVNMPAEKA